jgi:hypothetical protein
LVFGTVLLKITAAHDTQPLLVAAGTAEVVAEESLLSTTIPPSY